MQPFDHVELNHSFRVYLREDSIHSVEIVGIAKAVEEVTYEVSDGILTLDNEQSSKWTNPGNNVIELYITAPALRRVVANVANDIHTLTPITSWEFVLIMKGKVNEANLELACNSFAYWNAFPCGGKVTLTGRTDVLILFNFALMSIDAKELTTRRAKVENSSKGDCAVRVTDKLEYSITGIGDIHLYGGPNEILPGEISSSGQLIEY